MQLNNKPSKIFNLPIHLNQEDRYDLFFKLKIIEQKMFLIFYLLKLLTEQEKQREQIKKAMKSAASYNSMLQKEKKEERYSFFDLQTMVK